MGNERIRNDEKKYIIASDCAFNKTYDTLDFFEPEYYRVYHNKVYFFYDILHDYENAYKLMKAAKPNGIITIFDKALCFGMVLRRYNTFGCMSRGNVPKRVALLNERYIAEFMLNILHFSTYSVKASGKQRGFIVEAVPFDLDAMFADNKDVLEGKIRELMILLSKEEFMATQILNILIDIYNLGILYSNAVDEADYERFKKRIRVKESRIAPSLSYTGSESFKWSQKTLNNTIIK